LAVELLIFWRGEERGTHERLPAPVAGEALWVKRLAVGRVIIRRDRLVTGGTVVSGNRKVVVLAVRAALVLEAGLGEEGLEAGLAVEAVRVVLVPKGLHARAVDGLAAAAALGPKELHEILLAVRQALVLDKGLALQLGVAVVATKVLRVPDLATSLDVVLQDGLAAGAAVGQEQLLVVLPAVKVVLLDEEGLVGQVLVAVRAVEVLRVPREPLRLERVLANDLLITEVAHSKEPRVRGLSVALVPGEAEHAGPG